MELCNPTSRPRMRLSPVEIETASLVIGRSTYKMIYASKISLACGRQHAGVLNKISRYIPGFSNSPGFIIQKHNDVPADDFAVGAKRPKPNVPHAMGASNKSVTSQFVPLTVGMASAIFNKTYVDSLKGYLEEEIELGAGSDGGCYEERSADKTACSFNPPYSASKQKSSLGTLHVGTGFTNFNIIRHASSDGEFQFDGDDGAPQLLCQITMADSKADPAAPPMVRFSAPSSEMMKILECERFRQMIEARMPKRTDTPRPPKSASEAEPAKDDASDSD